MQHLFINVAGITGLITIVGILVAVSVGQRLFEPAFKIAFSSSLICAVAAMCSLVAEIVL